MHKENRSHIKLTTAKTHFVKINSLLDMKLTVGKGVTETNTYNKIPSVTTPGKFTIPNNENTNVALDRFKCGLLVG